jgi:hypothetical protein
MRHHFNRLGGISALTLTTLLMGCRVYEPTQFDGVVIGATCEPSELGSGDTYHVALRADAGQRKDLTFQWPEATRMCYEPQAAPNIGDRWTVETTNALVDPESETYYVPQWANVISRESGGPSRRP